MSRIVREIVEHAQPGAAIRSIRRLPGGLSATTHLVRLDDSPDLVVRRFEKSWHLSDGTAAATEAHCLARLARTPVQAPTLVWADPTGKQFGMGVVVASRVSGKGLARPERAEWVDGIARELAELHRLLPTDSDRSTLYADPGSQRTWLTQPAPPETGDVGRTIWPNLIEQFSHYRPGPQRIVHGDYHPGNVLSTRGQVTGVIDWEAAMLGPPAYDVGYCHMDLTLAHGPAVGDAFLEAYAGHAGGLPEHLTLFQLVAIIRASTQLADWLPSWLAQGVQDLELEVLEQRLARFATSTLRGDVDCRTTTDGNEHRLVRRRPI